MAVHRVQQRFDITFDDPRRSTVRYMEECVASSVFLSVYMLSFWVYFTADGGRLDTVVPVCRGQFREEFS